MSAAIGILSAAYYLPPTQKKVVDIFRDEGIPAEPLAANVDFRRDIGIGTVRLGGDEAPSSLALKAAKSAVEQARIDPSEIDVIVDFTSIPEDYVAPTWSAAGMVQEELGAKRAFATAVNTGGCASYHSALKAAYALMSANDRFRTALLFAGDKTPELNHAYYPVTVVCDAGSAVVLKKNHQRRVILSIEIATVGEFHDVLYVPGFPNRDPNATVSDKYLHMTGDIKKFNAGVIPINLFMFRKVMRAAVKRVGMRIEDVSYFIYPTFSTWDLRSFCEGFQIPPEKIYTEALARHGHCQENDMVINYCDAVDAGHIRDGDIVMVTTNGAGFTWGAALIRH